MIAVKDRFLKLTPGEYFIGEQQLLRHEYLNGEVYAMSGGTQNHGRIASNLIFILKSHLRGRCIVAILIHQLIMIANGVKNH